jgi:hypothetical protein
VTVRLRKLDTILLFRDFLVIVSLFSGATAIAIFTSKAFDQVSNFFSASFGLGAVICYGYACFLGEIQRQKEKSAH